MKKPTMILGLVGSGLFFSLVSAMENIDTNMMYKSTATVTDMKMMDIKKMSLANLVKYHGYTWSNDRNKLAVMAGIKSYKGTAKQNMMIRSYLINLNRLKDMNMQKDSMGTETVMKHENGMFTTYSNDALKTALASGKTVYLYFSASWCPACRSLDSNIMSNTSLIPGNTVIFKVDYDSAADLKKQYEITMQHTIIKLNSDGTSIQKIVGPKSVSEIVK